MVARQAAALVALRWRLFLRAWTLKKTVSSIIVVTFYATLVIFLSGLATVGFYALAAHGLGKADSLAGWLALMDIPAGLFALLWMWGLLLELQRSDLLDLKKFMHLPVSPGMIHGINFTASLAGPLVLGSIPPLLGLLAGLGQRYGWGGVLPGAAVAAGFIVMLEAWAHYFRGWMALVMEDKRKRQLVFAVLPLTFVLLAQLPSLLSHLLREGMDAEDTALLMQGEAGRWFEEGHAVVPLGWAALGLRAAADGNAAGVLSVLALQGLVTALGLGLGLRSTLAYYAGEASNGKAARKAAATPETPDALPVTLRPLPLLNGETAALVRTFFHSNLRHPAIRIQLIMPLCVGALLFAMYQSGAYGGLQGNERMWMPTALIVWPFLNFAVPLLNVFGNDGNGFRGLLLLPAPRRTFLLAKHLSFLPFMGGLSALFCGAGMLLPGGGPATAALSMVNVAYLYFGFCAVSCWTSVLLPFRMGRNLMRAKGNRTAFSLTGLVSLGVISVLFTPTGIVLNGYARGLGFPAALAASAGLAAAAGIAYRWCLVRAGDLLHTRETAVLEALLRRDDE